MFYFLIGVAKDKISGPSPTYREMMQNFLFYHWVLNKNKKESAELVVKNGMVLWNNLNIEVREKAKIEQKLLKEFEDWHNGVYKHRNSKSDEQKKKRANFKIKLDTVFDVSKEKSKRPVYAALFGSPSDPKPKKMVSLGSYEAVASQTRRSLQFGASSSTTFEANLSEPTLPQTRRSQRLNESSSTTSEANLSKRTFPRTRSQQFGETSSATTETTNLTDFAELELSDIDLDRADQDEDDTESDFDDPNYERYYLNEKKKVKFISNHVVTTIDAIGLSDYKAARLLTAEAQALGFALTDITVSRTTIQRRRAENRLSNALLS